jgi:SH3 domain-containing YSC84-like protein 1
MSTAHSQDDRFGLGHAPSMLRCAAHEPVCSLEHLNIALTATLSIVIRRRQLGAESIDLVLMVMKSRGVEALLTSQVTLRGEASAAPGPTGRRVEASTVASMRAEILGYSRSRGLFAGISLEGTSLGPDDAATEQVYGRKISAREVITGTSVTVPPSGDALVNVLQKRAPHNQSGTTRR